MYTIQFVPVLTIFNNKKDILFFFSCQSNFKNINYLIPANIMDRNANVLNPPPKKESKKIKKKRKK